MRGSRSSARLRTVWEAVQMTKALKPDVIAMDIQMPLMDGFEASREIMIDVPTPIVIVSSHYDVRQVAVSMQALSVGALAVMRSRLVPVIRTSPRRPETFCAPLSTMSQVPVIRHARKRDPIPQQSRIRPASGSVGPSRSQSQRAAPRHCAKCSNAARRPFLRCS